MVLILNGIPALLISIIGIKLLGGETWVDDPMGAHGACSILPILFSMAASLYVEPMPSASRKRQLSPDGIKVRAVKTVLKLFANSPSAAKVAPMEMAQRAWPAKPALLYGQWM